MVAHVCSISSSIDTLITKNLTAIYGGNITLEKPDNLTFQQHLWYYVSSGNNHCNKLLCNKTKTENSCHTTVGQFICDNDKLCLFYVPNNGKPLVYLLVQQGGPINITTRNITYILTVIDSTSLAPTLALPSSTTLYIAPSSIGPVDQHYTGAKNAAIIVPILLCIGAILTLLGYQYYRSTTKRRSKHNYIETRYMTVE
ncbi:protein RL11E [Cercopithecine betaherpesvirus 5]|uniref:Protein RL11E n=1 Tax=Simian cytomegalovirus (strain Colburn) TaxID=50292 RepID=G8XT67_SCMVC|nr:protein RL11E [Cercopithecine betaherpesvirus 5]AEV80359.1 protein RL11E [Cercopithecine betaherpesvirus 5]